MDRENWIEFLNIITMDDENIEKFKKLYGEGEQHLICEVLVDTKISFSTIIPEPAKNGSDKNWVDNSRQDIWSFRHFAEEESPNRLVENLKSGDMKTGEHLVIFCTTHLKGRIFDH